MPRWRNHTQMGLKVSPRNYSFSALCAFLVFFILWQNVKVKFFNEFKIMVSLNSKYFNNGFQQIY